MNTTITNNMNAIYNCYVLEKVFGQDHILNGLEALQEIPEFKAHMNDGLLMQALTVYALFIGTENLKFGNVPRFEGSKDERADSIAHEFLKIMVSYEYADSIAQIRLDKSGTRAEVIFKDSDQVNWFVSPSPTEKRSTNGAYLKNGVSEWIVLSGEFLIYLRESLATPDGMKERDQWQKILNNK